MMLASGRESAAKHSGRLKSGPALDRPGSLAALMDQGPAAGLWAGRPVASQARCCS